MWRQKRMKADANMTARGSQSISTVSDVCGDMINVLLPRECGLPR